MIYIVNDILPAPESMVNSNLFMMIQRTITPVIPAMINGGFAGKKVRYASELGCAQRSPLNCAIRNVVKQNNTPKIIAIILV